MVQLVQLVWVTNLVVVVLLEFLLVFANSELMVLIHLVFELVLMVDPNLEKLVTAMGLFYPQVLAEPRKEKLRSVALLAAN